MKSLNIHSIKHLLVGAFALAALMTSSAFAAGETIGANVSRVINPIFPIMLSSTGVYEGSVTVMVDLDNEGKMIDWMAVSATREEFVTAVSRVIESWEFTPAYKDGKGIPYALSITIKFKAEGVMMAINGVQAVQAYLNGMFDPVERSLVAKYSDLDVLPTPVSVVQPMLSSDIPEDMRKGEVIIGFFIDATGKVRMPVLLKCDGDIRLAYAAYDAIVKWQFAPPTVRGHASAVRARQKFIFTVKTDTKPAK